MRGIDYKSLQLSFLEKELKANILKRKNIMEPFEVIVSNKNVAQSFKSYFVLEDSSILMNVKFYTFSEFVNKIIKEKGYKVIPSDIYKLLILKHIKNFKDDEIIKNYIKEDSKDYASKLYDITDVLYNIFKSYENDLFNPTGFEKDLYQEVICEAMTLGYIDIKTALDKLDFDSDKEISVYGFIKLSNIEEAILNKYRGNVNYYMLERTDSKLNDIEVVKAISMKREVEVLHTNICKRLRDGAMYSDILVLAPNMASYEPVVLQVFNQDNKEFVNVECNFLSNGSKKSALYEALVVLYRAIKNDYIFTRYDFSSLIENDIIKNKFLISKDLTKTMIDTMIDLNVYNDYDFIYLKNRIILSKVSDMHSEEYSKVLVDKKIYLPYESISLDNDSILTFVNLIDVILNFIKTFKNINVVNKDNIYEILQVLDSLFNQESDDNILYKKLRFFIYNVILVNVEMPLNTFLLFMLSYVNDATSLRRKRVGIVFRDFNKDYITRAKYIYFLGLSANNFPTIPGTLELDYRKDNNKKELEDIKNTFYIQLQNANEVRLSYTYKNLKTDEEFFSSPLLNEIIDEYNLKTSEIKLKDSLDWGDLFSRTRFRNKDFKASGVLKTIPQIDNKRVQTLTYKAKDFSEFLTEPFSAKAKLVFNRSDETLKELSEEYMPFEPSPIQKASILEDLTVERIKRIKNGNDSTDYSSFKESYLLNRTIPNLTSDWFDESFEKLNKNSIEIVDYIKQNVSDIKSVKIFPTDYDKDYVTLDFDLDKWNLVANKKVIVCDSGDNLKLFELKKIKQQEQEKNNDYMLLYVTSLIYVILMNKKYNITLYKKNNKNYDMDVLEAKDILNKIYGLLQNKYEGHNIGSRAFVMQAKDPDNLYEYLNTNFSSSYGAWGYFDDKKMFPIFESENLGYQDDTFLQNYKESKNIMTKLVKFLNEKVEE